MMSMVATPRNLRKIRELERRSKENTGEEDEGEDFEELCAFAFSFPRMAHSSSSAAVASPETFWVILARWYQLIPKVATTNTPHLCSYLNIEKNTDLQVLATDPRFDSAQNRSSATAKRRAQQKATTAHAGRNCAKSFHGKSTRRR